MDEHRGPHERTRSRLGGNLFSPASRPLAEFVGGKWRKDGKGALALARCDNDRRAHLEVVLKGTHGGYRIWHYLETVALGRGRCGSSSRSRTPAVKYAPLASARSGLHTAARRREPGEASTRARPPTAPSGGDTTPTQRQAPVHPPCARRRGTTAAVRYKHRPDIKRITFVSGKSDE